MIIIAKTFKGLEQVLHDELVSKGFKNPQILNRAVSFVGNEADLYRANYVLSTALRILKPIREESAINETQLYNSIHEIPWHRYFTEHKTFRIDITLTSERYTNSLFLAQKSKDAVVDRFRKEKGKRPNVDTKNPDIIINVHVGDRKVKVFLDSSGDTLNKRGYRKHQSEAPINEVLARGLIKLSGWKADIPLLDIMCGSGTIPFEALYEIHHIPAACFRKSFSFMYWNDFDENLWTRIKEIENNRIKTSAPTLITGLDINHYLIEQNKEVLHQFPKTFQKTISFVANDFLEKVYTFQNGFIISNLPYNERIKIDDLKKFYHDVGSMLKFHYSTNKVWLLLIKEASKFISLKPSAKYPILNGKLECTFNAYDLY